jgi:hypothetical protein
MGMMSKTGIERMRSRHEERLLEHAKTGVAYESWNIEVHVVHVLDMVLGDTQKPGYRDPSDRFPFGREPQEEDAAEAARQLSLDTREETTVAKATDSQ